MTDAVDVVVVGAGPAGMAAACTLAAHGVETRVLDEQSAPGGQVYRAVETVTRDRAADLRVLGEQYAQGAHAVARFRGAPIEYVPHAAVWEIEAPDAGGLTLGVLRDDAAATLRARHALLATGAIERPTPFPGWTLPGVMSVGAAQTLLKASGMIAQGSVALAGSGPLLYLFAWQMLQAQCPPATILDTSTGMSTAAFAALPPAGLLALPHLVRGLRWLRGIHRSPISHVAGVTGLQALGEERLRTVRYRHRGRWHELAADLLLVHDGVMPNAWLAMSAGCEHYWHRQQQCWHPRLAADGTASRGNVSIVGDAGGIVGSELAAITAELAAMHVAHRLGAASRGEVTRACNRARTKTRGLRALRRFLDRYYRPMPAFQCPRDDDTLVCRCEEVTVAQINAAAALGCTGPNQGKAFTRCGMGPCMGRECGITVGHLLDAHHGLGMQDVGYFRIRPPVKPITVGQLADLDG